MRGKSLTKATITALGRMRAAGRKLILATGQRKEQLAEFPHIELFDLVVGENGALLYSPVTKEARPLAEPPPPAFVRLLRKRGVDPLSLGEVIVSTEKPHDSTVAEVIGELGLDWRVIYNRRRGDGPAGRAWTRRPAWPPRWKNWACRRQNSSASATPRTTMPMLRYAGCGAAVASAEPAAEAARGRRAGGRRRGPGSWN